MIQPAETDPNRAAFKYKDIPLLAKDARDHGLENLVVWGWCNFFELPITLREELGTKQEFLDGIKAAREMGVNVIPFISVQWMKKKYLEKYGVPAEAAQPRWVYHQEYVPKMEPYYMGKQYPVSQWEIKRLEPNNKPWLADVKKALVEWIDEGIYSWCWDVCLDGEDFLNVIEDVRVLARSHDAESSFGGESHNNLEVHPRILDFTWCGQGGHADPVLSVLKVPRVNQVVLDSVKNLKRAFCKGQHLTLWTPRPGDNEPAGSGLLADIPDLSKAVKECSNLRKQFLDYFVNGYFIGDSILQKPASVPVLAHQLDDRLLIFVFNNTADPKAVDFEGNLGLWLPNSTKYLVREYDSTGKLVNERDIKTKHLNVSTQPLGEYELAIYEVITKPED